MEYRGDPLGCVIRSLTDYVIDNMMTQQVACTTPIAQTKASFPASLIISNHRNFKGSTLLD
jgi:hypothetical protein